MDFYIPKNEIKNINDADLLYFLSAISDRVKYKMDTLTVEPDVNKIESKEAIVVGDLDYCGKYLENIHGIKSMNPIEVPNILRKEEFLHREYEIVDLEKVPKSGTKFIKYASKLKEFNNSLSNGNLSSLFVEKQTLKPGVYVVSDWIKFEAEYRVFVELDEVKGIQFYNGNTLVMPDTSKIIKMINTYMMDKDRPQAYTMDIGVTNKKETVIIEVHPFVSCGLYGYFGYNLPYMYRFGLDYYKNINKPIEVTR